MPQVRVSTPHPGVGLLLLDAPPMNKVTAELMEKMEAGLDGLKSEGTRVVVIGSAVPDYFIAHGDLAELLSKLGGVGEPAPGDPRARNRVQKELDTGPMVSIAAIDGQCWGGGAGLAWACDLRVASETSSLGHPEVILGIPLSTRPRESHDSSEKPLPSGSCSTGGQSPALRPTASVWSIAWYRRGQPWPRPSSGPRGWLRIPRRLWRRRKTSSRADGTFRCAMRSAARPRYSSRRSPSLR